MSMSKYASEAWLKRRIQYCGHRGYFMADVFRMGDTICVRAKKPVTPDSLIRKDFNPESCHFHIQDSPYPGGWWPHLGLFLIPKYQLTKPEPS